MRVSFAIIMIAGLLALTLVKPALLAAGDTHGAGAGVGAAIGEHVAYESGGDLRNLKPAFIGISAAIGAGVGALLGSMIGSSHATIYLAR